MAVGAGPTRGDNTFSPGRHRGAVATCAVPFLRDDLDRRIVRLAVPALGTLAVEPVYVLVDTAIVGQLGTPELAGVAIASLILLNLLALVDFLEYLTPDIAFAVGSGRVDHARRTATTGLWLTALIGVPAALVVGLFARPLCWLVGGRGEVLDHATTYLSISAIGVPFVLVSVLGHGVLRGYNDMRNPLRIVVVANVANLVLEVVAVYGLDMGVAGSAGTTVVVQVAAAAAFLWAMRHHLARHRPHWAEYRPLLVTGAHAAIRAMAMYTVWNLSTVVAARMDDATLAANQVVTQLFMFLALVLDALAVPLHSLVAGALGAGRAQEAAHIGERSVRLSVWGAGGLALVLAASAPVLPLLFTDDPAVRDRLVVALLVLVVMQFPGAVAFALDGALIGAHDMGWLGRQAILNIAPFVLAISFTVVWPSLGLAGIWGAQMVWMTVRAAVNHRRWQHLAGRGFDHVLTTVSDEGAGAGPVDL